MTFFLGLGFIFATPAFAADTSPPPAEPQASEDVLVHRNQPKCIRWTDECVSCTRNEKSDEPPVCSNIGPACQPKAIRCVEPEMETPTPMPEKETPAPQAPENNPSAKP